MKILITGARGNIGAGIAPLLAAKGHGIVLTDVGPPDGGPYVYHQADLEREGVEKAAEGCDLVLHTAAWHGIHWQQKSEADYWRLNVDGTYRVLQDARSQGVERVVFLSSTVWYDHYGSYGFTKRIGEEILEYHRRNHGLRYVAVRPNDLTPWGSDWTNGYGTRLLYGGVDRADVLDGVVAAVDRLAQPKGEEAEGLILEALRPDAFAEADLEGWEHDPSAACERIFPGSRELVQRYGLRIDRRPHVDGKRIGWGELGYAPKRHFGTFLEELRRIDAAGGPEAVRAVRCPYAGPPV